MKYLILFISLFFVFGCTKKDRKFYPSTKLETILKNQRINKAYYDFRLTNIPLSWELRKQEGFIQFAFQVNVDDLLLLTECENPIVRCFAFEALIEKDYSKIREVLFRHKNDNENVDYLQGRCIKINRPVKFFMLERLSSYSDCSYRFTKLEYEKVNQNFMEE